MKKIAKRFISLLAVFAMLCTMLTVVYAADPQFEVMIDSENSVVEPGDTFTVTVKLNNLNSVRSGDIFLSYDKAAFDIVIGSPAVVDSFDGLFSAAKPELGTDAANGLVKLAFASGLPLTISDTQDLFTADFTAKSTFGAFDFSMADSSKLYVGENNNPDETDFTVKGAGVTITSNDDATLKSLAVSAGTLSPAFAPETLSYDLGSVANSRSSLVITADANNPDAAITYNGAASNSVSLSVGDNTINIVVTAKDGTTTKTYVLKINRAAASSTGGGTIENTIKHPTNNDNKDDDNNGGNQGGNKPDEGRPSDKFTDLAGYEWAIDHIDKLMDRKIVEGTSETTFEPGADVTRAQFAKMIVETFGLELKDQAFNAYIDVKNDDWFKSYVDIASQNGIVNGYPNGTFLPNARITREEMCVMLARALTPFNLETKDNAFADKAEMSDWAMESINLLSAHGVIVGKGDNNFAPKDYATRAESAVVISRIVDIVEK